LSKIIKAADLKILIPNEEQTLIPAAEQARSQGQAEAGTILEGSNLLQDAQRKAESLTARAKQKAEALMAAAEAEAEALHLRAEKEGFEQGRQEGLRAGKEEALREGAALITVLEQAVQEGARARAGSLAALEDDVLKLSLLLADKIVRKTVQDDLSWLEPIIKEALSALGAVREIIIRLNPVDYAIVSAKVDEFSGLTRAQLQFESDATVNPGGCVLESENGMIDARLEKRLGKLGKHLMEVLYDEGS